MNKMRTQLITLSLLLLSLTAEAQHPFLSREVIVIRCFIEIGRAHV